MPRLRRLRQHNRRDWTSDHLEQLASGADWFGTCWGNVFDLAPADRHGWPVPEVCAEMRECFDACQDEIEQRAADGGYEKSWGALVFVDGLSGAEAYSKLHPQSPAPPPNQWQIDHGYAE